jgi:hypothetical protein
MLSVVALRARQSLILGGKLNPKDAKSTKENHKSFKTFVSLVP